MFKNLQLLLSKLGDAEFQAVLLGPFIVFALLIGTLLFITFFATKNPTGQIASLAIILLGGLAILPLDNAHRIAGPRVQAITGIQKAGYSQKEWYQAKPYFLGIAILATVTLFFGRTNKLGLACTLLTILAGLILSTYALWLVYREARIYHPGLRAAAIQSPSLTTPIAKHQVPHKTYAL